MDSRDKLQHDSDPGHESRPGSVTGLFPRLKEGDCAAVHVLWERFFQRLVRVAARRVDATRDPTAPEDVAMDAILALCKRLASPGADRRFPSLKSRDDLWKLLVAFTANQALNFNRKKYWRQQIVRGESVLGEAGFAPFAGREPDPEFAAGVADLLALLPDERLAANQSDDDRQQDAWRESWSDQVSCEHLRRRPDSCFH